MSTTPKFAYGEALQKSLLFYEAQRSGDLPSDNRIEWRRDSALNDASSTGRNLSGGYYDAGDHMKFGFPLAGAMTMLSWGVVQYRNAYTQSGQLDEVLATIKWATDYILKTHETDGTKTIALWGQVGNTDADHNYWGAPETMTMARPAAKIDSTHPGSDLAAETAATLASASLIFRATDPVYADKLLKNAKQLYTFADTYRGKYSDSITDAKKAYASYDFQDELAWGAAWLYKATGESQYLTKAEANYTGLYNSGIQSWDQKSYGTAILLSQLTNKTRYRNDVEGWLNNMISGNVPRTAGGMVWLDRWGSARYSATLAFLAGVYSDTVNAADGRYNTLADKQINYILGDNPNNFSYMVGFGTNYPKNPHHRASSGTNDINKPGPNAHILYGGLVGGPKEANDNAYQDDRGDYIGNEVALDYNAAFTGALARMYGRYGGVPLTDQQLDNLPGIYIQSYTVNGTTGNDNLVGGVRNDTLNGLAGDDSLNGGAGADKMIGGTGNDRYTVDNIGDTITETTLATDIDTVYSSVNYTLAANIEQLILTGTAAINGTGNTLNNNIYGNTATNTLNGGAGADKMIGGTGNDRYIVDNIGDTITETTLATDIDTVYSSVNYTLAANVEQLILTGTAAINGTGNTLNNNIYGNTAINTLNGGIGNDYLSGGAGADKMIGGTGNDIYIVDNISDTITETTLATDIDTVYSSVNYTLVINVERLVLTGTAAINGTGNAQANLITGNSGNNILSGGAGNDTLTGGLGADRFQFSNKISGIDQINDFLSSTDKIAISASGFGGNLVSGSALIASQFLRVTMGSSATTSSQRLIYNSVSGGLFFDADGSGVGAAVQFATLANKPTLGTTNFMIIA